MTGDGRGGLFALSVNEAQELLRWEGDVVWVDEDTAALKQRIEVWIERHSEATP